MCTTTLAALLGLATGCAVAPAASLAPADPALVTRWHAPPSPLAGVKTYQPVEARSDWGQAPSPAKTAPMPGMDGKSMKGMSMKGMSMKGMSMDGGS